MSAVLGWDPGVNGGGAVLARDGKVLYAEGVRPDMTEKQLSDMVGAAVKILNAAGGGPAFVEKVQYIGKRRDGRKGDGGKGAFTFGGVYKFVLGCLHTRDIVIVGPYPMAWQSKMECVSGGNKAITERRARELFPAQFPKGMFKYQAHRIADALLIAEYGRRVTLLRDDPLELWPDVQVDA